MLWLLPTFLLLLELALVVTLALHLLLRRSGSTETRLAWLLLIILLPLVGAVAYLLLGVRRTSGSVRRHREIRGSMPGAINARSDDLHDIEPEVPRHYQQVFTIAERLSDTDAMAGHAMELMGDANSFFDRLVEDIDAATSTIHLLTYIFLDDSGGNRVVDALIAAADRGVVCRVLVDAMGSRRFLDSDSCRRLKAANVHVAEALPTHVWAILWTRLDIRNHRKIIVIDNSIGWIGSQNMAAASFGLKPRFAPWVDCMVRLRGPAVHNLQELFLEDWYLGTSERLGELLEATPQVFESGATVQIFGSGPNFRNEVLPMIFQASIGAAEEELIITTPYFVPDMATSAALRAAALRGVRTVLVVPARNDSRLVAMASRGHYEALLEAGVEILEFNGGLLHAKTMTVDRQLFMVGSANLDRRSLELNFEVNMLGWDHDFASLLRFLQTSYMDNATQVDPEVWAGRSIPARIANSAAGLLSPLL